MSLDDFVSDAERLQVAELKDYARRSAFYPKDSKERFNRDDEAFKYINQFVNVIQRQRFVAEYYRLRSEYEKQTKR